MEREQRSGNRVEECDAFCYILNSYRHFYNVSHRVRVKGSSCRHDDVLQKEVYRVPIDS